MLIRYYYFLIMIPPGYAVSTPNSFIYLLLAAIVAIVIVLIFKRPKSGSIISVTLFMVLALLIGVGVGWTGRYYFETHQSVVDCPQC